MLIIAINVKNLRNTLLQLQRIHLSHCKDVSENLMFIGPCIIVILEE